MDGYLRLSLILVSVIVVLFILLDVWLKRRRYKLARISANYFDTTISPSHHDMESDCAIKLPVTEEPMIDTPEKKSHFIDDILVLYVFAKPNTHFASYDLLQAITATGMQYGEMNIFHYYVPTEKGRMRLFSLASATKPGDFDLDGIGDFSCVGLTLFMDIQSVAEPEEAFQLMLKVAEQLADDLEGELRAEPNVPWNNNILTMYQQKIKRPS